MPAGEGIKETIESIVVALILAFVFRAFVVEAFVIPTGSMAPTLYGAHGTIICEDCGTEFAYGLRDRSTAGKRNHAERSPTANCPNCRHENKNLAVNDKLGNAESGDRILVLKWPYDIGIDLLAPARWDVTVFKTPADGVQNYIKRMAGLPGEVLMIVDGDVYTVPTEELSAATLGELKRLRHEKYELRKGIRQGRSSNVPRSVLEELDKKLTIARKTPAAQRELWFRVYDHDYPPRLLDEGQPHWQPALGADSGWDASNRRVQFVDRGNGPDWIELAGIGIQATYAYNVQRHPTEPPPPVADLRVRFVLTPMSTDGAVRIRLERLRRVFWATVRVDGLTSITESPMVPTASTPPMLRRQLPPLRPGRSVEISFENVDYMLALRVDGREVLTTSSDREAPGYYGPDIRQLRRKYNRPSTTKLPRIYGERGSFELVHLVVERDVYYYNSDRRLTNAEWARSGWGSTGNPILLREGEYFMLGDNSAASQDSRLWDTVGAHLEVRNEAFQLGTVPEDQLIGKAFFVYWPAGHRLSWLPRIGTWNWSIIPDVGRMRWIR